MGYFYYPAERVVGGRGRPSLLGDNVITREQSNGLIQLVYLLKISGEFESH